MVDQRRFSTSQKAGNDANGGHFIWLPIALSKGFGHNAMLRRAEQIAIVVEVEEPSMPLRSLRCQIGGGYHFNA
jgi:hypothetical protein